MANLLVACQTVVAVPVVLSILNAIFVEMSFETRIQLLRFLAY